jgi:tetratricopeptide (TPR) repeat protein
VAGASGGGKSAIFARVYEELTGAKGEDFWLLAHAAGIDPRSTSVVSLLEDWVGVLAGKLGVENPLALPASAPDAREPRLTAGADKRAKPEEAFADLLAQAAKGRRVVLLLDALDRFERTPQAEQLTWLPAHLPANVRLIATAVTGPETVALARRPDFAVESLVPLTKDEASEIAQSVYDRYHRQPNREAVRVLGEKAGPDGSPAHGNALWLVSALEEMNLLDGDDFRRAEVGTEGTDEDRLHAMVVGEARAMPGDVEGLYARIFARAGRRVSDDPREGRALARAFAVVIALSRAGLRERDLAALIPGIARLLDPSGPTLAWDALAFASLRRALRAHLVRRGEDDRWDFHHRQARSAAERAYLPDAGTAKQIHALVADHLLGLPADDPLAESEAMYHLIQANNKTRAAKLYAGGLTAGALAGATQALADHAKEEAGATWVAGLVDAPGLSNDEQVRVCERFLFNVWEPLERAGTLTPLYTLGKAALVTMRRLLAADPTRPDWLGCLSVSLSRVGDVRRALGDLEAALAAFQESLDIDRELVRLQPDQPKRKVDLSLSLNKVGEVESGRGNLDAAMSAFRKSLGIRRELARRQSDQPNLRALSVSLERIGDIESARGNLDAAITAFQESLGIRRELVRLQGDMPERRRDLSLSIERVGEVESARGNLDAAMTAFRESLGIYREIVHLQPDQPEFKRDVALSLQWVGDVESARGNLGAALAAFRESRGILRELVDMQPNRPEIRRDLSLSNGRVGDVESARGNLDAALSAFRECLGIFRELVCLQPDRPVLRRDLSVSLQRVGDVESARGNLDAALSAFQESVGIFRELVRLHPDQPEFGNDLSVSLGRVALVFERQNDKAAAANYYDEALSILFRLDRDSRLLLAWRSNIAFARAGLDRCEVAAISRKEPTMADYSLVRNGGIVCGLWFHDITGAKDENLVEALLAKHDIPWPKSMRIVPNRHDNAGGCFVMFDSAKAPGE